MPARSTTVTFVPSRKPAGRRSASFGELRSTTPAPSVLAILPLSPWGPVGTGAALIPGTAAVYELEDVRGYQALTFARYVMTFPLWCKAQPIWFNRVDDLTKPFLSFLNVRYAITGMNDAPPGWHVVAEQYGSRIVENERVLPRAFVPRRVVVGRSSPIDTTLEEMQAATDFGDRVWAFALKRGGTGLTVCQARDLDRGIVDHLF